MVLKHEKGYFSPSGEEVTDFDWMFEFLGEKWIKFEQNSP